MAKILLTPRLKATKPRTDGRPNRAGAARAVFGSRKGTVLGYARPFEPLDAEWTIDRR